MDDEELIVHTPRAGETLGQYLRRYTTEQRRRIFELKDKSEEFSSIVLNTEWASSEAEQEERTQRNLENLWRILESLNNYSRLLHFIRMLVPVRRELLSALHKYAGEMAAISKWCTVGRILGFTVDSAGTVGGLCLAESSPTHASWALSVGTAFGLLGLASTVTEMKFSIAALDELINKIQEDQKSLAPIQAWYQQSSELEKGMENIFPFDLTNTIVQEFVEVAQCNQFNPVKLLSKLFQKVKELGLNPLRDDAELTEYLIRFVNCREATELCLSLFLRRQHPILLDIARLSFQLKYSSWPFYICQSVAALAPNDRRGFSIPVLGRLTLNFFSITDGIYSLRKSVCAGESQMRKLRAQLELELATLLKIGRYIERRADEQTL